MEEEKLRCKLIGEDGNIFNLMAIVARTMRQSEYWKDRVQEMYDRVRNSRDYYAALMVLDDFVIIE